MAHVIGPGVCAQRGRNRGLVRPWLCLRLVVFDKQQKQRRHRGAAVDVLIGDQIGDVGERDPLDIAGFEAVGWRTDLNCVGGNKQVMWRVHETRARLGASSG